RLPATLRCVQRLWCEAQSRVLRRVQRAERPQRHRFAKKFLESSGCHAVIVSTTDVNWMLSLLTDMLFPHRFYRNEDPWKNLRKIYDSVVSDFKPAAQDACSWSEYNR